MIKQDEINAIKYVLKHCKKEFDMIPYALEELEMPFKRKMYLLNKWWWLDCGVSPRGGWLNVDAWQIKEYYKNQGIVL